MAERISVSVRIRPLSAREQARSRPGGGGAPPLWRVSGDSIAQLAPPAANGGGSGSGGGGSGGGSSGGGGSAPTGASFTFDKILDVEASNANVYALIGRDLIASTLRGINGTIIAYGQTSSGKTHTMYGSAMEPGVVPLAIDALFAEISAATDRLFLLRVSMLEIYNDNVTDLLSRTPNLQIREEFTARAQAAVDTAAAPSSAPFCGRFVVKGLTEEVVRSREDVLRAMSAGDAGRHVGGTAMNERSSRSHTVLQLTVESTSRAEHEAHRAAVAAAEGEEGGGTGVGAVRCATLTLVDLAGSERQAKTGALGFRLKEGCAINTSLHHLSVVIAKLTAEGIGGGQQQHVPYRDSPLTKILQPALGGNARTALICTATLADEHAAETLSTLKFAAMAKAVTNRTQVNEFLDDKSLIRRLRRELATLRAQLATDAPAPAGDAPTDVAPPAALAELQQALAAERGAHRSRLARIGALFLNSGAAAERRTDDELALRPERRTTWCPGDAPLDAADARRAAQTLPAALAAVEGAWEEELKAEAAAARQAEGRPGAAEASEASESLPLAAGLLDGRVVSCRRRTGAGGGGGGSAGGASERAHKAALADVAAERDAALTRAADADARAQTAAARERAAVARAEAAEARADAAEEDWAAAQADVAARLADAEARAAAGDGGGRAREAALRARLADAHADAHAALDSLAALEAERATPTGVADGAADDGTAAAATAALAAVDGAAPLLAELRARDALVDMLRARCAQAERAALTRAQQLHVAAARLNAAEARHQAREAQHLRDGGEVDPDGAAQIENRPPLAGGPARGPAAAARAPACKAQAAAGRRGGEPAPLPLSLPAHAMADADEASADGGCAQQ